MYEKVIAVLAEVVAKHQMPETDIAKVICTLIFGIVIFYGIKREYDDRELARQQPPH